MLHTLLWAASWVLGVLLGLCLLLRLALGLRRRRHARPSLAFFHPYCNDGGGGERVLWKIIEALRERCPESALELVVFSGDANVKGEQILLKAQERFGISLPPTTVRFVFLKTRPWVEARRWPYFTMLGQSLGSMLLGFEALLRFCPDVYFDTMGYAFTFPIFWLLGGCQVAAYVHYPTISNDMLEKVSSRSADFNNRADVAQSPLKSTVKLFYYRFFALLYRIVGSFASLVLVNSSWTKAHIEARWPGSRPLLVFPPVDCAHLRALPLHNREKMLVSIAQFRPEKNHQLQLEAFALYRQLGGDKDVKLVMLGSVRKHEEGDERRVQALLQRAQELGLGEHFQLYKDVPKATLNGFLGRAWAGLHTMKDEHFGIGVVEFMAAGVIPIAHDSAGPKMDIVVPHQRHHTGFLATTVEEYAEAIKRVFKETERSAKMRAHARASAERFSDESFSELIIACLKDWKRLPQLLKD